MRLIKGKPKTIKNLIICPFCEDKGMIKILGEIEDRNTFKILRFHRLYKGSTKIVGRDFSVICGDCGNIVYCSHEP